MTRKNLAFGFIFLGFLFAFGFGVVNLLSSKLMPWHEAALGVPWDQLSPGIQAIFLAYMKIAAGGLMAFGVAAAFILFVPFRRGEAWAVWAIGAMGIVGPSPAVYGLYAVQLETGVAQPWFNPLASVVLVSIGVLLALSRSRN